MTIAHDIWWQRNVISYDHILWKTGQKNGTEPRVEDLKILNPNPAPDPLELLIDAENTDTEYEDMSNSFKDLEVLKTKEQEETVKMTPALKEMLSEMANRSYSSFVRGGNWIATLMKEDSPRDYIANLEETKNGLAMGVAGIELYAYNRDLIDHDPSRVGMSSGQWSFLNNMAEQVQNMAHRLEVLSEAGFDPDNDFTSEYNAIKDERRNSIQRKAEEAKLREHRKQGALNHATEEVKNRLSKLVA